MCEDSLACYLTQLTQALTEDASQISSEPTRFRVDMARFLSAARFNVDVDRLNVEAVRFRVAAEKINKFAEESCKPESDKYYDGEINLKTEQLIVYISQLLTYLITEKLRDCDSNKINRVNLQLSNLLTELLNISVTQQEVSFDSRKKIANGITGLLTEILLN